MDFSFLWQGLLSITWQQLVMYVIGGLLIYLAIEKGFEPALLMPMGFGAILVNLPLSGVVNQFSAGIGETPGIIQWLFEVGIEASEAMPLLLFIGIGAMIDFGPLLANPKLFLCGAAAQAGIFLTIIIAVLLGFDLKDAASIGIIGAADGPTSLLVSQTLKSNFVGAIAVAAYSYMALVPIIQPFAIKLATTKKDRAMKMLSTLSNTAQNDLANLITLLLGITISFSMKADQFVRPETFMIMGLGLVAFVLDSVVGVLFVKVLNIFTPSNKINPMVGAAGISAFPMSSRVIEKLGQEADSQNHLLMHAIAANVSGQIASVVAGGVVLQYFANLG